MSLIVGEEYAFAKSALGILSANIGAKSSGF
jgi:hypothetical protein